MIFLVGVSGTTVGRHPGCSLEKEEWMRMVLFDCVEIYRVQASVTHW